MDANPVAQNDLPKDEILQYLVSSFPGDQDRCWKCLHKQALLQRLKEGMASYPVDRCWEEISLGVFGGDATEKALLVKVNSF